MKMQAPRFFRPRYRPIYRIVPTLEPPHHNIHESHFAGQQLVYKVQFWWWWWPFWTQVNSFRSEDDAYRWILGLTTYYDGRSKTSL